MRKLGKCPKCDAELTEDDSVQIKFKGIIGGHHAYRCKKCDYIIGFSSMWKS